MPVTPNVLERLALFRLDKGPAPILDLFAAAGFESVCLALDLGLFETLAAADGPLSAAALADRVDAHPDGIARLCALLAAERYLATAGEGYRLTRMTETWLVGDDPNMGPWFTFWNELVFPFWAGELETAVREGAPSRSIYEWFDESPGRWELAQAGFRSTASLLLDDAADAVTVPEDARRVLDVGGGHGLYAMELCRRHPALSATVFDLPGAADALEVPADLDDRIEGRAGDYLTDDLGEGYDLALLFNVVHAHDPAANAALLDRVADALVPGGRVAVLDQWEGSGRTPVARTGLAFVALTYLATLGADIYPHEDVAAWLHEAGFAEVRRRSVGPVPGLAVVEAAKPA